MSFLVQAVTFLLSVLTVKSSYILLADPITHKAAIEVNKGSPYAPAIIEIFMDLLEPKVKQDWQILIDVLNRTSKDDVRVVAYQFPLPWHRNSYLATEGLFYVKAKHANQTMKYINDMFENAPNLTMAATMGKSERQIIGLLGNMTAESIPKLDKKDFQKCVTKKLYNSIVREGVRYGYTRGVKNVPWFFVNGVEMIPGTDGLNPLDWVDLINKLKVTNKTPKNKNDANCKNQEKRKHENGGGHSWPWLKTSSSQVVMPMRITIGLSIFMHILATIAFGRIQ